MGNTNGKKNIQILGPSTAVSSCGCQSTLHTFLIKTQAALSSKGVSQHQLEKLKHRGFCWAGLRVRAKELGHGYLVCSPLL